MNAINPSAYSSKIDYSDVIHIKSTKHRTRGRLFRIIVVAGVALLAFIIVYSVYSTSRTIKDLERINQQMDEELKLSNEEIEKKEKMISETEKEIKNYEEKISEYDKQIENLNGHTLVSEGIAANYMDMMNYAVFGLIKLIIEK